MTLDAMLTVPALLAEHERVRPDAVAVDIDGRQQTWAELAASARAAAASLRAAADPQPGERVGLYMANDAAWLAWAFGASLLGCTFVPINTRLRGEELAYQLRHSGSVALVCTGEAERARLGATLRPAGGSGPGLEALRAVIALDGEEPWAIAPPEAGDEVVPARVSPDDVLLIQYTSGTTAHPKGVMLTHRQVLTNARGVAARLRVTAEDRLCSPSPFFHVAGTTLLVVVGLVTGARVIGFARFEPATVLATIERERATYYCGVETFFIGLLKDPGFRRERLASVRTGWIAASSELVAQVHESMGLAGIANVYGISEAAPNVTIADADDPPAWRQTSGRPHSGTEVRIVGEQGPLPDGETGLIEVRGPCVMKGYLDSPGQTAEAISPDGWLTTGDLGHIDAHGNLVYEGRSKDMLRVGGENVAPAEIEALLLGHPDLAAAAVVGIPHDRLIEVPAAFVVAHAGREVEPEAVTDYVAAALAPHKVPRLVIVTEDLPMTGSGKVRKQELVARARVTARPGA